MQNGGSSRQKKGPSSFEGGRNRTDRPDRRARPEQGCAQRGGGDKGKKPIRAVRDTISATEASILRKKDFERGPATAGKDIVVSGDLTLGTSKGKGGIPSKGGGRGV